MTTRWLPFTPRTLAIAPAGIESAAYSATALRMPGTTTDWRMWFKSEGGDNSTGTPRDCIRYATSTDGVSWSRANSDNPVLIGDASPAWDRKGVRGPRVYYDQANTTFHMIYEGGVSSLGDPQGPGHATSSDGITWAKDAGNPLLTGSDVSGFATTDVVICDCFFLFGGNWHFFGSCEAAPTKIWHSVGANLGDMKSVSAPALVMSATTNGEVEYLLFEPCVFKDPNDGIWKMLFAVAVDSATFSTSAVHVHWAANPSGDFATWVRSDAFNLEVVPIGIANALDASKAYTPQWVMDQDGTNYTPLVVSSKSYLVYSAKGTYLAAVTTGKIDSTLTVSRTVQSTANLIFNGSGYVGVGPRLNAALGSVSLWIKPAVGTTGIRAISDTGGYWFLQFVADHVLELVIFDGGAKHSASTPALTNGVWYHLMAVWNSTTIRLFLNGFEMGSPVSAGALGSAANDVQIGGTSTVFWNGAIDDVALWNTDQSAQAMGIANGSTDVSTLSPTGLWRLDEGTGTTAADGSGNGHNGTFGGSGTTWGSDIPLQLQGSAAPTGSRRRRVLICGG